MHLLKGNAGSSCGGTSAGTRDHARRTEDATTIDGQALLGGQLLLPDATVAGGAAEAEGVPLVSGVRAGRDESGRGAESTRPSDRWYDDGGERKRARGTGEGEVDRDVDRPADRLNEREGGERARGKQRESQSSQGLPVSACRPTGSPSWWPWKAAHTSDGIGGAGVAWPGCRTGQGALACKCTAAVHRRSESSWGPPEVCVSRFAGV